MRGALPLPLGALAPGLVACPALTQDESPNGIDAANGIQISGGEAATQAKDVADRIDGGG